MYTIFGTTEEGKMFKGSSMAETPADALAEAQKYAKSNDITLVKVTVKLVEGKSAYNLVEKRKRGENKTPAAAAKAATKAAAKK
jgi:hypothetical protein